MATKEDIRYRVTYVILNRDNHWAAHETVVYWAEPVLPAKGDYILANFNIDREDRIYHGKIYQGRVIGTLFEHSQNGIERTICITVYAEQQESDWPQ